MDDWGRQNGALQQRSSCLVESNAQIRREGISALDNIETLKPRAAIAAPSST
jgi:hypothetical protein